LEGVRGRKKWFAPTSFRNEVSFLNDTARRDGIIIEIDPTLKPPAAQKKDVRDDSVIAAGMQHAQKIANSKLH
jgi:hypothetical protein